MRGSRYLALLVAASVVAAACGSSTVTPSAPPPTQAPTAVPTTAPVVSQTPGGIPTAVASAGPTNNGIIGGKLVIDNESGSTWTCQFNPFNPSVSGTAVGFVYEPLEFVNALQTNADGSNKVTPWLATGSQWSPDFKTLTFTVRSGVKWSDGQPFSAADVVYTYMAIKGDAALDLNAIWSANGGPLTDVAAQGTDQVVFTFSGPAQTYFYYVADQIPIIPQHIWSKLDQTKLDAEANTAPIGTGPYLMSDCSQNNIKYLRNPTYWQSTATAPVPQIAEVDYPSFLSNTPANLMLAQGQAQWGAQYIPNIQSFYIDKDPAHRHYWFPATLNVSLFPNLKNSLLSNVAVRKAISLAINRADVSQRGESGYEPPANQTGIVLPTYTAWYDKTIDNTTFDVTMATNTLESAGFKKGSDGIYANSAGKKLSFTIKTISGYTDWDSSLSVITQELKAAGIAVKIQDEDTTVYTPDLQKGNFDLAYGEETGGPLPYYELRQMLLSSNICQTNYSQYNSPAVDTLFNSYASANAADQLNIIHQIEQVMVTEYPVIPVVEGVDWYQYDTTDFGGWPTPDDPYAQPPVWATPDNMVVLTHIYPLHP